MKFPIQIYKCEHVVEQNNHWALVLGNIHIARERPGVISFGYCWVIIQDGYMYGPSESLWRVFRDFIFEHKHDKNLVG